MPFAANVQLRKVATKEAKEVKEDDFDIAIPDKESPLGNRVNWKRLMNNTNLTNVVNNQCINHED